eukprot:CAMPEP_0173311668 /NCGR_PEP_ID=MMETSP1143-20121109/23662_1 /TAXON_ID=483371 /ORGANISM="non described non described, Strain CCMP2298" /LENGTH=156 /DNA_ID=CAMNT_0014253693 /DNA_START=61 /DNA_END=531 /DNA_ORIENTATION=-
MYYGATPPTGCQRSRDCRGNQGSQDELLTHCSLTGHHVRHVLLLALPLLHLHQRAVLHRVRVGEDAPALEQEAGAAGALLPQPLPGHAEVWLGVRAVDAHHPVQQRLLVLVLSTVVTETVLLQCAEQGLQGVFAEALDDFIQQRRYQGSSCLACTL